MGLVPSWAKDSSIGFRTINARAHWLSPIGELQLGHPTTTPAMPAAPALQQRHLSRKLGKWHQRREECAYHGQCESPVEKHDRELQVDTFNRCPQSQSVPSLIPCPDGPAGRSPYIARSIPTHRLSGSVLIWISAVGQLNGIAVRVLTVAKTNYFPLPDLAETCARTSVSRRAATSLAWNTIFGPLRPGDDGPECSAIGRRLPQTPASLFHS